MGICAWLRGMAAPLVAVAAVGVAGVAGAAPIVEFSTSGSFSVGTMRPGVSVADNDAAGDMVTPTSEGPLTAGDAWLGVGDDDDDTPINTFLVFHHADIQSFDLAGAPKRQADGLSVREVSFGYFTLESTDPNGSLTSEKYRAFDGAQFTLSVTQYQPTTGTGSWASKLIHGNVWYQEGPSADGTTSSYLAVKFADPLTFSIPNEGGTAAETIKYTIEQTVRLNVPDGQLNQHFSVNGNVAGVAAPLPGVAWVGLTLLGGLGGARGWSRFRGRTPQAA